mmetsp:Transcript_67612/g.171611  ORF Transcript_67612/g.171611 Transcript_67612/m.171611 type:complete len:214 (-) Transcript_67612:247-888(-)
MKNGLGDPKCLRHTCFRKPRTAGQRPKLPTCLQSSCKTTRRHACCLQPMCKSLKRSSGAQLLVTQGADGALGGPHGAHVLLRGAAGVWQDVRNVLPRVVLLCDGHAVARPQGAGRDSHWVRQDAWRWSGGNARSGRCIPVTCPTSTRPTACPRTRPRTRRHRSQALVFAGLGSATSSDVSTQGRAQVQILPARCIRTRQCVLRILLILILLLI